VWGKASSAVEFKSTAKMFVRIAWWVTLSIEYPTGCCIHEFAARMK